MMIVLIRPECPNPKALVNKNYKDLENKEALRKSTAGKCMYCESKIEHISYAHVEHIKPKKKFPELEFVWDNLGFSCQVCNTNKWEKYDETTPFINPYSEKPENYIVFMDFYVYSIGSSERSEYTINELQLNRAGLVERRKERYDKIKFLINAADHTSNDYLRNQIINELKTESNKDKEYSAMIKSVLIDKDIL